MSRRPPGARGTRQVKYGRAYAVVHMAEVKVPLLHCRRCGHEWIPRGNDIRVCPGCKSAWWDVPKKEK